jgi:hypothetical protein
MDAVGKAIRQIGFFQPCEILSLKSSIFLGAARNGGRLRRVWLFPTGGKPGREGHVLCSLASNCLIYKNYFLCSESVLLWGYS